LNIPGLNELFERLALGALIAEPAPVTGGLLHRTWKVTTASGRYAVKQLNPAIVRRSGARDDWLRSEKLARTLADAGVPAVPALTHDSTPLQVCGDATVMIYPWIDGLPLATGTVDVGRCRQIGLVLARIHRHGLSAEGCKPPSVTAVQESMWRDLQHQARRQDAPFVPQLDQALPLLTTLSAGYSQAIGRIADDLVLSHRDLDQKNVLWRDDNSPALVDWEGAGLINPHVELFDVALNWSGLAATSDGQQAFRALIQAYRTDHGLPGGLGGPALLGVMGNWMDWLAFNLERYLDPSVDAGERTIATAEVLTTLEIVQSLHRRSARLIDVFNATVISAER